MGEGRGNQGTDSGCGSRVASPGPPLPPCSLPAGHGPHDEPTERAIVVLQLCRVGSGEVRRPLIHSEGEPRQPLAQERRVHEEPCDASVAVGEGVDPDEPEVNEDRPKPGDRYGPSKEAISSGTDGTVLGGVRDPDRIGGPATTEPKPSSHPCEPRPDLRILIASERPRSTPPELPVPRSDRLFPSEEP